MNVIVCVEVRVWGTEGFCERWRLEVHISASISSSRMKKNKAHHAPAGCAKLKAVRAHATPLKDYDVTAEASKNRETVRAKARDKTKLKINRK